ncbi:MAG: hypothetical protein H7A23_06225 [Leptospiraceae bacterium]|nr:hypothetical protein [Leptospiraceae bacterium]MCP5494135.1 hypothetical protein [Leptospiraceae bacterium]
MRPSEKWKNEVLSLDGNWEFYWKEFLRVDASGFDKIRYIAVPASWHKQGFPSHGYATYKLTILQDQAEGSNKSTSLGITMPDAGMAYSLYINGELYSENGKVERTKEKMVPYLRFKTFSIPQLPKTEIVIYVSNYHNLQGGLWKKILLGDYNLLLKKQKHDQATLHILFGSFCIMSLYLIGMFFYRRKDKTPLYFGLFCVLIAMRTICVQERPILEYFPYLPFLLVYKLEYVAFYLGVPLFSLYLQSIFPREFSKQFQNWIQVTAGGICIAVIISSLEIYTLLLNVIHLFTFLVSAYLSYVVLFALLHKRRGALLFLIGGTPFFWSIINDILYNMNILHTFIMGGYGFLIFIIFQTMGLSKRFSQNLNKIENTTFDLISKTRSLEYTNKELYELKENLEKKVYLRTEELEKEKENTLQSMRKIEILNEFTKLINSTESLDVILSHIYDYITKNLGLDTFWLLLVDKDKNNFYTHKLILPKNHNWTEEQKHYLQNFKAPLNSNTGTLYQTYISKDIFYLPDIHKMVIGKKNYFVNQFNGKEYYSKRLDIKILIIGKFSSLVQIPLIVKNNTIGILNLAPYNNSAILSRNELLSLIQFGEQIAGVIRNMKLLEETEKAKVEVQKQKILAEKTKQEIEVLNTFNRMINELTDLESIFVEVSKYIFHTYHIEEVWLLFADEKRNELVPIKSYMSSDISEKKIIFKNQFRIPLNNTGGFNYLIYKRQKPFYVPRLKKIAFEIDKNILDTLEVKSFLSVPMLIQEKTVGIVYFSNSSKEFRLSMSEINSINGFCQQIAGVIHNSHLLKETEEAKKEVEVEKEKSEKLLLNILPKEVAEELKQKGTAEPVIYESVTVVFTDFKGFTKVAEGMNPKQLIAELDNCFSYFDSLMDRFNLEKLKTIGDSYMFAGGIPKKNNTNFIDAILASLEIQAFMNKVKFLREELGYPYWELRLGIHSGPLIAGVIGEKKFAYDVWGDTVNTASRMESSGTPGMVNISNATYQLAKGFFNCEYRGKIQAKNKGEIDMYYVHSIKEELSLNEDGVSANEKFLGMYKELFLKSPNQYQIPSGLLRSP